MIRIWHILLFALALAAFAVVNAPASLFPQRTGVLTYSRAEGSVWQGRFEGATLFGLKMTEVVWHLKPSRVLQGELAADVTLAGPELSGEVTIVRSLGARLQVRSNVLRLEGLPLENAEAVAGLTMARNLDVRFVAGQCVQAQGSLESDLLVKATAGLGLQGPSLSGQARCAGSEVQLPLNGQNASMSIETELALRANGTAQWRGRSQSAIPQLEAIFMSLGFTPAEDGDGWEISRNLTW
jgi:hypothetical protein